MAKWGQLDDERGYLNKWEMHKALKGRDIGHCKLPATELYNEQALVRLLKRFRKVYVKPVDTWGGCEISFVEHVAGKYLWIPQGESHKRI